MKSKRKSEGGRMSVWLFSLNSHTLILPPSSFLLAFYLGAAAMQSFLDLLAAAIASLRSLPFLPAASFLAAA